MSYVRLPVAQLGETEGSVISGGAANSVMYSDGNGALGTLSTFSFLETNGYLGLGLAAPSAKVHLSAAATCATAYGVTGVGFVSDAATWTDTATASGTISVGAVHSLGIPTLAFSNAATITNSSTLYIAGAPVAGTNATLTTKHALHIAGGSIKLGVSDFVLDTVTGTKFGTAASQKLAFFNATPIIQRVGAAQAAVAATGATNSTPFGYTGAAQADAIVTLVNEIRSALIAFGLISGAA